MKKYFLIAVSALALASCSNDAYLGDNVEETQVGGEQAIAFGGGTGRFLKANLTGADAATKLGNEFKVYGVKQNRSISANYDKVFVDYTVKYNTDNLAQADYNDGWYYVGAVAGQTIKYWDYSSADYHFVAGSPVANFTYTLDGTTGDIQKATVTGMGGRLNDANSVASNLAAVYIADPVVKAKSEYEYSTYGAKREVEFTFRSAQTKVRAGIYETIPGYKITAIKFYNNNATPGSSNFITLNSATDNYFIGSANATATLAYNWAPPEYTFDYTGGTLVKGKYWEGGEYTTGVPAVSATGAINDLYGKESDKDAQGYFVVMPTPSATVAAPLTIKCDYTLTSLDASGETIKVTGATATIPAAYAKWAANTMYTYLFKISDNTNGSTGTPGTDPAGLYPIVFDAVVVLAADGAQGTVTSVSTPSITVYQEGNVVENGITYKAGAVDVKAYEGTTETTTTATWSYVELDGTTFDYSKDYEKLGTGGEATAWTSGKLTTVAANKTFVIKAVNAGSTAYFVLIVGAEEVGPANPSANP